MVDKHRQALNALGLRRWMRRETPHPTPVQAATVSPAAQTKMAMAGTTLEATTLGLPDEPSITTGVPEDWEGLRAAVENCQRCELCRSRSRSVFGTGPRTAPLMIVGEGPGQQEDRVGEPFVGPAGKLLDDMLRSIACSRQENAFVTNVVKCRPPANRDPRPEEVAACRPYLDRQIALVQPKLLVGLGRVAAQRLLEATEPLFKLRGQVHHYGISKTPVIITYHPAYLLRSPGEKAKAWADLKRIACFLKDD